MSRGRLDPQESASPIDLAAEDIDDAEDDRLASADESLVETYRDEPDRSTKPKPRAKPKAEPRSPRPKVERTSPVRRVVASPPAKAPPEKATPAATTPRRTRPLPPLPPSNAKIEYDD